MKYKQQRQEKKKIVFVVDGAARNWKINLTNLLIKLALMAAAADPNKNNLLLFVRCLPPHIIVLIHEPEQTQNEAFLRYTN